MSDEVQKPEPEAPPTFDSFGEWHEAEGGGELVVVFQYAAEAATRYSNQNPAYTKETLEGFLTEEDGYEGPISPVSKKDRELILEALATHPDNRPG